jgi:hypothetical protein
MHMRYMNTRGGVHVGEAALFDLNTHRQSCIEASMS